MSHTETPAASTYGHSSARERLDAHVREIVKWHFDPATGCPFWLERAKTLRLRSADRRPAPSTISNKFGFFEDEWLRGGPVRRWVPKGYAGKPIYVFETGGTTGIPKSRINHEDFRIDYRTVQRDAARRQVPARARTG